MNYLEIFLASRKFTLSDLSQVYIFIISFPPFPKQ